MQKVKRIKIDQSKIRTAIQAGIPLAITTYTLPMEMAVYIEDILKAFLKELNQEQMFEGLSYCVKELTNNAKKANTKRVYFRDKKLDINNKDDYEKGMATFKADTLNNIRYYLEQQRKEGLYIKVSFQTRNSKIKIEVRNKSELTSFEYKRIHDKITRAQQYDSIEDGMTHFLDETEGAGLGLVIMILILKKIGLTEENYQVTSENNETVTKLILPFSKKVRQDISILSKEFVNLIKGLPEFPENINEINRLINDPKSRMSDIAMHISNDVSLTAELIKLVNSAAFSLASPCHSIGDAVKMAGLRGIRNLLFSIGSMRNLMISSNEENKRLWDHSYKVAFYSYNLARNFCKEAGDRSIVEDSYVCGLLHDMGKIIFETAHPDILKKIHELCEQRGVSASLFESLIAGVNHGEVGALIAEKWNFPPVIVSVIRHHHEPEMAPKEVRKITSLIYLADLTVHFSEGEIEYDQIDTEVLSLFKITSQEQLEGIATRLKKTFIGK
ncbi:MAG: HDOD domain-containing protein [Treponema sp.]|nr:HDOD domain-containing protein [Spirochaetia bacterium]MDD7014146.1 HDOD domain-containing protein [Spirochaetales bacterium]MDY4902030.1 HDOD domain-containing protein [Treponema sp.]